MTSVAMPLDLPDAVVEELQNPAPTAPLPTAATSNPLPRVPLPDNNQRVHQRVVARFPYTIMLKKPEGQEIRFNGYTEDISLGGVSIGAVHSLPLQTLVAIRVELFSDGRSERIVAMAKCIHQSYSKSLGGFRQGFQFINLNEKSQEALTRYIRSRAPA